MHGIFARAFGKLFKRTAFDNHFHIMTRTLSGERYYCFDYRMRRRMEEIKLFWRENRNTDGTPEKCAWNAVEDFGLWVHSNNRKEKDAHKLLVDLAGSLHFSYPEDVDSRIKRGDRFPGSKILEPYAREYIREITNRSQ